MKFIWVVTDNYEEPIYFCKTESKAYRKLEEYEDNLLKEFEKVCDESPAWIGNYKIWKERRGSYQVTKHKLN